MRDQNFISSRFRSNVWQWVLLGIILLLAAVLRVYKIDSPVADHHSWRQSDTAAVARNFIKEKWDFSKPRIDNMTSLHSSGSLNKEKLFLVEPPVYQTIVAGFYRIFGVKENIARLVTIFFSLGSVIFLFFLSKKYFGLRVAVLSSFFFSFLPYNVFFSRVILPEPMIVFLVLGFIYFFIGFLEEEKFVWWLIALVFGSLSLTQKAFPFFVLLPITYLVWKKYSLSAFKKSKIWIFFILAFLPIIIWRLWISQFPEGIPPYDWLFNQNNIRFKGAFFWWIFAERIGKLILGYWGLIFLGLGLLLTPTKKEGWFFHLWFLSIVLYVVVFAAGNVTHDYYQIPFIPIISIFLAKGADLLLRWQSPLFSKLIAYPLFIICISFMLSFSWREIRDFYNIQGGVDLAGRAVDELTPKDALVLTGDSNDATLLYNTNRYGWTGGYASSFPNSPEVIEKVKKLGGSVYVTTKWNENRNSDFGRYMVSNYQILKETDQFIIFDIENNKK